MSGHLFTPILVLTSGRRVDAIIFVPAGLASPDTGTTSGRGSAKARYLSSLVNTLQGISGSAAGPPNSSDSRFGRTAMTSSSPGGAHSPQYEMIYISSACVAR